MLKEGSLYNPRPNLLPLSFKGYLTFNDLACLTCTPPSVMTELYYRALLDRLRKPRMSILNGDKNGEPVTLETFMSYGLGSGKDGKTISQLPCGNNMKGSVGMCTNAGLMACSRVSPILQSFTD